MQGDTFTSTGNLLDNSPVTNPGEWTPRTITVDYDYTQWS